MSDHFRIDNFQVQPKNPKDLPMTPFHVSHAHHTLDYNNSRRKSHFRAVSLHVIRFFEAFRVTYDLNSLKDLVTLIVKFDTKQQLDWENTFQYVAWELAGPTRNYDPNTIAALVAELRQAVGAPVAGNQ